MRWPRPTIRLRLTAWYAGIFLLLGAALLIVSYAVVRENFDRAQTRRAVEVESTLRGENAESAPRVRGYFAAARAGARTAPFCLKYWKNSALGSSTIRSLLLRNVDLYASRLR